MEPKHLIPAALALGELLAAGSAFGQGAVMQSGVVIPNDFAAWTANGIIKDSGVNSITLNFPNIANGHLIGNATGSLVPAQDTALSALIDTLGTNSAQGNILYRNGSSWAILPPGTAGQFLETLGPGANPAWNIINNPTYAADGVSLVLNNGTFAVDAPLTVPYGGTGLTAGNSGGVLAFSAAGTMVSSAALTASGVVLGGGAGAAPYPISNLGTSGQVLTSNGPSADPSFQNVGNGTVTQIVTANGLTGGPITATGTISGVNATASVTGVVTPDGTSTHYLSGSGTWTVPAGTTPAPLVGTTGTIGGSTLAAGACTSGTVVIASSTTAEAVAVTPVAYPGDGILWEGYVSTAGTVTAKICNFSAGSLEPTATTYNVRVIP